MLFFKLLNCVGLQLTHTVLAVIKFKSRTKQMDDIDPVLIMATLLPCGIGFDRNSCRRCDSHFESENGL